MAFAFANGDYKIAIFDLTRTAVDHSDYLYDFAESLKNGFFFVGKYSSRQHVFKPPHVVFFANTMPKEGKWTEDRLKLLTL